jgi:hypothetical protein
VSKVEQELELAAAPVPAGRMPAAGGGGVLRWTARRGWGSPTLMTWGSYLTKSLTFFLVLPLVLTRLPAADIALWYLFTSLVTLQLLADLGFGPTFVRVIAYATGGAETHELFDYRDVTERRTARAANWTTVEHIWATMGVVYNRLTLLAMVALASIGSLAVARPISLSPDPGRAWAAWGVILVGSTVALRGNRYASFLQGLNKVALVRRWEAITNLCSIAGAVIVLLLGGSLLELVVVGQLAIMLNILRNWWLCRIVEGGRVQRFTRRGADPVVLRSVWPSAWRSGLGMVLAHAPLQFSGVFFAQIGSMSAVATYLLAVNLMHSIRGFSMAPFYSKIPVLARLRSVGDLPAQRHLAQRGMRLAYWAFAALFVGIGVSGEPLLAWIGSNAAFPDPLLWGVMGTAMFAERFGAMHLHLYSTTNHVIWHTANGVTSALFVALSAALFALVGVYAFPVAYLVSTLGFYAVYCGSRSHAVLPGSIWSFERTVVVAPAVVVLAFSTLSILGWMRDGSAFGILR